MEIEPRPSIIVLKKCQMKKVSPGGIALPDSAVQPNSEKVAIVVKVGGDVECVKPGDVVAFSPAYVDVVALSQEEVFIFCMEKNILAILK